MKECKLAQVQSSEELRALEMDLDHWKKTKTCGIATQLLGLCEPTRWVLIDENGSFQTSGSVVHSAGTVKKNIEPFPGSDSTQIRPP